jgi:stringent starvation protein B
MFDAKDSSSTRPYLIRALYEWCTDNGFTPYVAVLVDDTVRVPQEYVKDGEIVLNISFDATSSLKLGNEFIEFKARFAGTAREIMVPVGRVIAIYARENGQGMAFPSPVAAQTQPVEKGRSELKSQADAVVLSEPEAKPVQLTRVDSGKAGTGSDDEPPPRPPSGPRPSLKRVK